MCSDFSLLVASYSSLHRSLPLFHHIMISKLVAICYQVVLSVGYFLSCLSPNVDVALAVAPVVIIPFMLFGGFFLNSGSVPV